ncbi:hypothetical protein N7448_003921 [Penicillium atrosanguineum]|nr:hypothetical protein N7448_003921 [Penicillium atrosanguineum]
MCSDFPLFPFVAGFGTDMRVPSPRPEKNTDENGHVTTEPQLLPASSFATLAGEGRSEEVPSSPSPFTDPLVNGVDLSPLTPLSSIPALDPALDRMDHDAQITALPDLSLVYQPDRLENLGVPEENTLAMHPQLAPIPEETTEDDAEEYARAIRSHSNLIAASNTTPSPLLDVSHTVEPAAWIPLAPSISTELPVQAHAAPQSFPEAQYISNHAIPTSSNTPSYSEDLGDSSSAASTNGEGSSVFDDDDDYSDTSSYTASLLSSVKNYAYENGRRYHSYREGHYVLPNDEQEQDRQDLLHHVRNLVLNGALFRAPVGKDIQRALDIGTGTGIWAIDFADSFPSAEVIGTDLSPIQPSWSTTPNPPWLYSAARPFDFIHARDLGGAIANWPRLLHQAYDHLRPGGWVELQEFEVTLRSDDESLRLAPTLCEFLGQLHEASEAFHRPMNIAEGHRQRLVEAGFEDVRDEVYKVPSSAWSRDPVQKQIGRYNLCSLLMAVESYSLALFTRVLGWSNNETQVFLAGVRRDLRNPDVHTYCNLHIVYGRKPWYRAN